MTKSAPPGVAGFNWAEAQSAFLQGKIGMWLDGVGFAPPIEDPDKSRVVGKVGYGVMPKGPKAHASGTFGDGIGVDGRQREEGGRLSVLPVGDLARSWARACCRPAPAFRSASRSSRIQKVREGVKMPASWVDAVAGSGKISRLALPVIVPVTEFRDIYRRGADQHDRRRRSGRRS